MRLTRAQVEMMYAHAKAAYPDECCGLIVGPPAAGGDGGAERFRIFPCRNVQNEMHARDPETYPRTARRAFLIDPFELERILQEAKANVETLRGIFHSHPDEDVYFSQEDKEAAVPFGDIPAFPDAAHIVMSIRDREIRGCHVYCWDGERKDFVACELEVVEGEAS